MASRNLKNERYNEKTSDASPKIDRVIGPMSKVSNIKGPSIKGKNVGPEDAPYYDNTVPSQSSGKDSDPTTSR